MKNNHINMLIFLLVTFGALKAKPAIRTSFLPIQAQTEVKNDGEQENKVSGFLQDQSVILNMELRKMTANIDAYIAKEKFNDKYHKILKSYKDLIQEIYKQFGDITDEIFDKL